MFRRYGHGHRLRNKVLLFAGNAVVKRPAVYNRQLFSKVTMAGRTRNGPFQSCGLPRVVADNSLTCKEAPKEVEDEDELSCTQNKGRIRNKYVHGLLGHEEHILRRIVNATHLAADT